MAYLSTGNLTYSSPRTLGSTPSRRLVYRHLLTTLPDASTISDLGDLVPFTFGPTRTPVATFDAEPLPTPHTHFLENELNEDRNTLLRPQYHEN
jgi:hypothetical protein